MLHLHILRYKLTSKTNKPVRGTLLAEKKSSIVQTDNNVHTTAANVQQFLLSALPHIVQNSKKGETLTLEKVFLCNNL